MIILLFLCGNTAVVVNTVPDSSILLTFTGFSQGQVLYKFMVLKVNVVPMSNTA